MKFKTVLEKGTRTIERDGIAVEVTEDQERKVPVLPRDWSAVAVRAAVTLVMTLTVASVAWSTYSIGSLLGGGVGFIAAAVFDLGWAVCLILEWLARYLPAKRVLPRRLGWALLVATMGAIWWHGWAADSIPLATVGAAVSAFAKVLWLGVMKHIDRELTPDDAAWVAARISEANAKAAVADATRNATRMEQRATLERLAMQREQAEMRDAFGIGEAPATPAGGSCPGRARGGRGRCTGGRSGGPGGGSAGTPRRGDSGGTGRRARHAQRGSCHRRPGARRTG